MSILPLHFSWHWAWQRHARYGKDIFLINEPCPIMGQLIIPHDSSDNQRRKQIF